MAAELIPLAGVRISNSRASIVCRTMSSRSIETRSQINLSVCAINCLRVHNESGESRDVTKSAGIELQSNAHTNDSGDAQMGVDMGKFAQVGCA